MITTCLSQGFFVYCECCNTKIYNESAGIHTMSDVMKSLPDAMSCHKLGHFIDGEKIRNYLSSYSSKDLKCVVVRRPSSVVRRLSSVVVVVRTY